VLWVQWPGLSSFYLCLLCNWDSRHASSRLGRDFSVDGVSFRGGGNVLDLNRGDIVQNRSLYMNFTSKQFGN
jgi:hypothetical protein